MRVLTALGLSGAVAALAASFSVVPRIRAAQRPVPHSHGCTAQRGARPTACVAGGRRYDPVAQPFPAGDAPAAFLLASVQPMKAPVAWRRIYHEVERCAGKQGNYDAIRWAVMDAPLVGPKGPTYAFTVGRRIVLVRDDTTYLRHEMLHHILEVSGWRPRPLKPGEHYTIADLHPMPLFGLCTGGH